MQAIAMREWAFGATIALLSLAPERPAAAQNSNAPNITGRVTSVAGGPLPGVEVRIDGTRAVTQTDDNGAYRFARAPTGTQTLLFHRIGYLPGALTVNVPSVTDSITLVEMVPARNVCSIPSRSSAHIYDVGGIVVDEKNRPVAGATVDVIGGTATSAVTADAGGWFTFPSVKLSGPLIIKARKPGFVEATFSLDVKDSRGVVLHDADASHRPLRVEGSGL